jgi:hypothetical protein
MVAEALDDSHARLKDIVAKGKANDWAVEEYAEAVRGTAKASDHLELPAPVEPDPPPPPPVLRRFVPERDADGRILAIQEVFV